MADRIIYLDNAATTRPRPEVVQAMLKVLTDEYGNPSSAHRLGVRAERAVERARSQVAGALGVSPRHVVFTSGGTEANNLALLGAVRGRAPRGGHVVVSAIEHASVLEAARRLAGEGWELSVLPVSASGHVDPGAVEAALRDDTVLVSIMAVNAEVGSVQPVAEIGRRLAAHRRTNGLPLFHVDAVQAFGKLAVKPDEWHADLVSLSSHKIEGPKGVGALYVRDRNRLVPLLAGGGQQGGLRPGTENVPGIVGFGEAALLAAAEQPQAAARMLALRRRLIEGVEGRVPGARVNGPRDSGCAPHVVNFAFPGAPAAALLHLLSEAGVCVSAGSACSARKPTPSHVLLALGLSEDTAGSSLRFSLSPRTTPEEVDTAVEHLVEATRKVMALTA